MSYFDALLVQAFPVRNAPHVEEVAIDRIPEPTPDDSVYYTSFGLDPSFPLTESEEIKRVGVVSMVFEKIFARSKILCQDEVTSFSDHHLVATHPELLTKFLQTAYNLSLVTPFCRGLNRDSLLLQGITLEKCAQNVRKNLRDNGAQITNIECSRSPISCIPQEFCTLKNLRILDLDNCSVFSVPDAIGNLSSLTTLSMSGNRLSSLPETLGNLSRLEALILDGNRLASLPASFMALKGLRVVDVSNNLLTKIPEGIYEMCFLERVSIEGNDVDVDSAPEILQRLFW